MERRGRRVDGGRPPARRGSRDAVAREFEAELARVRMPELEAKAECVIDFDRDVTAGRTAGDASEGRWLFTAVEVGELLGCTTRYVRELVRRGEIHAVPIGRLVRIPAAEVEAFVARRLAGVEPSARPVLGRPGDRLRQRLSASTAWDDELPPDLVW